MKIILASASPRRKELLANAGLDFEVKVPDCDENLGIKSPKKLVTALAKKKVLTVAEQAENGENENCLYIAADTVVYCKRKILGKPADSRDAARMLKMLSCRTHKVATGVALYYNGRLISECEVTKVRFKKLTENEINDYAAGKEPLDKAGAYAIQGTAARWISGIKGDYFNVVGLPLYRTFSMMEKLEISPDTLIKKGDNNGKGMH